jgi:hypothetical protein
MNLTRRSQSFLAAVLVAALLAVGCGSRSTAPVAGRIKFQDGSDASSLAGYEITLTPVEGKSSASGTVQPDGSFELSTVGDKDGAMPGSYKVALTPPVAADPDKPPPKPAVAAKYNDPETSGLTIDVKPGRNTPELTVERRP